ncbi:pyruvate/2-oxoglutarate dehydrogenase complex dihydrolipoamide acyltransferase (E2) component [Kitasatospora gansuensis]|uniref:Pyruvate/2-oxoglutarate dehydrogenase complex dihydrolipoamide acyltransferase (E2) component n=1 Tax=Kitasatospora gansuensis TaxID=258050 RepID=A0A7W7SHH7_9ACTN|nr:SHOCT domain-containing protein [Kitasatospora gansuensis]MBB4950585.1 pyruvate/2-oxoglutarate dehydrogenase complex dihydrolipoamide acyltransferase (E2) component [Kitasatospora gansuensis]
MFRPMRPIRPMRVVRPVGAPLVRGLVVGGAAYAAGRSAARSAQNEQDQNAAIADLQAQQAPPPAYQPPPAAAQPDLTSRLTELGQMVQQGLLTPEEFATAKARLLAG